MLISPAIDGYLYYNDVRVREYRSYVDSHFRIVEEIKTEEPEKKFFSFGTPSKEKGGDMQEVSNQSSLIIYGGMAVVSVLIIVIVTVIKRKKRNKKDDFDDEMNEESK